MINFVLIEKTIWNNTELSYKTVCSADDINSLRIWAEQQARQTFKQLRGAFHDDMKMSFDLKNDRIVIEYKVKTLACPRQRKHWWQKAPAPVEDKTIIKHIFEII